MRTWGKVLFIWLLTMMPATMGLTAPQIQSEAAYLINADNNKVLYEKNGDKIMYPASTTKIMTTLVALQHGELDSIVTVGADAVGLEGSSLGLKAGDQLTLRDLLRGMMAVSGNDAAQVVAEQVGGGSSEVFINWMNETAAAVGASSTHFSNPHGLPDPDHQYTTAQDLAVITAYAYQQPGFGDYVSHKYQTIRFINRGISETEVNMNELLGLYPGCNGVKTGTTQEAGECLVASAKRNGVQLIAVVLNSSNRWQDAAFLLDYGFKQVGGQQPSDTVVTKQPVEQPGYKVVTSKGQGSGSNGTATGGNLDNTTADNKLVSSRGDTKWQPVSNKADSGTDKLLEVGWSGGGSVDAAYLFPANGVYLGPVVKRDSQKTDKITCGVRLAEQLLTNKLAELGVYGDGSADAAYLFQVNWGYVGPTVKYDRQKTSKVTFGVRCSIPI
ncbi:MAG: dacB 2 [Firmicutes bacterium]|nr:dacB 2 [Bacillota bacterium]